MCSIGWSRFVNVAVRFDVDGGGPRGGRGRRAAAERRLPAPLAVAVAGRCARLGLEAALDVAGTPSYLNSNISRTLYALLSTTTLI